MGVSFSGFIGFKELYLAWMNTMVHVYMHTWNTLTERSKNKAQNIVLSFQSAISIPLIKGNCTGVPATCEHYHTLTLKSDSTRMSSMPTTKERHEAFELDPLIGPSTSTENDSSNKEQSSTPKISSAPSPGGENGIRSTIRTIAQNRNR